MTLSMLEIGPRIPVDTQIFKCSSLLYKMTVFAKNLPWCVISRRLIYLIYCKSHVSSYYYADWVRNTEL